MSKSKQRRLSTLRGTPFGTHMINGITWLTCCGVPIVAVRAVRESADGTFVQTFAGPPAWEREWRRLDTMKRSKA